MLSDSDRALLKGQLAALGAVKLVASALTLYYFPSWHALLVVVVLSLPWIAAGCYYGWRVGHRRYRHWQYRHLRARLLREEWDLGEDTSETVSTDRQQHG